MGMELLKLINQPISIGLVLLIGVVVLFVKLNIVEKSVNDVCTDFKSHITWHLGSNPKPNNKQ